jgi:hypothetical protein
VNRKAELLIKAAQHDLVGMLPNLGALAQKVERGEPLPAWVDASYWRRMVDRIKRIDETLDKARKAGE